MENDVVNAPLSRDELSGFVRDGLPKVPSGTMPYVEIREIGDGKRKRRSVIIGVKGEF